MPLRDARRGRNPRPGRIRGLLDSKPEESGCKPQAITTLHACVAPAEELIGRWVAADPQRCTTMQTGLCYAPEEVRMALAAAATGSDDSDVRSLGFKVQRGADGGVRTR